MKEQVTARSFQTNITHNCLLYCLLLFTQYIKIDLPTNLFKTY